MRPVAILVDSLRAAIGPQAIVYALAAIGLNIHFGYTGLLNFGQAGFMLLGAFGVATTVNVLGGSLWVGLLVAVALAVVFALLLGAPTLRLRADYLAITTIAAAEILRLLARSPILEPLTGGVFGQQQFAGDFYRINPLPPGSYGVGPLNFNRNVAWVILAGWTLVALTALFVFLIMRSPWGRVIKSIRENEDAARSLGKNVYAYKMQSLVLGGVIGALAGALLGIAQQQANPDAFTPVVTFFAYCVLILGGPARAGAPILGTMIFWAIVAGIDTALRQMIGSGIIPQTVLEGAEVGIVRFALVGLGLMLLMIYRPQGIFGDKEEIALEAR